MSSLGDTPLITGNHLMIVWQAVRMRISMLLNQSQNQ